MIFEKKISRRQVEKKCKFPTFCAMREKVLIMVFRQFIALILLWQGKPRINKKMSPTFLTQPITVIHYTSLAIKKEKKKKSLNFRNFVFTDNII